jgi:hypothetical protein
MAACLERPKRIRFGRAVAIVLCALVFPSGLFAHVQPMSVREMTAASPDIVVATVERRESRWNALHTLILTGYTLRVEERLRGAAPERISLTVPGGTLGSVADDTCISVHLETGARYLLFLNDLDPAGWLPVTGAGQGAFREIPGAAGSSPPFIAAGTRPDPLTLEGRPVTFRDFTAAVRDLAAQVPPPPQSRFAAPRKSLPAKAWDPAAPRIDAGSLPPRSAPEAAPPPPEDAARAVEITEGAVILPPRVSPSPAPSLEKYLIVNPAKPPVVVNPLTDSDFAPWDQYQMAYWNRYRKDLFRVAATPSATWSYGNGVSDMVGFPDDATMAKQFGTTWSILGDGVLAVTFTHHVDGVLVEADTVFNPNLSWTLDDLEATRTAGSANAFKDTVLHELGHVWGLWHPWDQGAKVTWDSVMNYKPRVYYLGELFADDTAAVRHAFPPGVALRDGLISSYTTIWDGLDPSPDYRTAFPTTSELRAGGTFGLAGPIKVENVGTVPLVNPQVDVYLAPVRLSLDGAVLIKRTAVRGRVLPGATLQFTLAGFKVPRGTPPGTYWLAYLLRDSKDAYPANNRAWSRETITVTVTD